MSLTKSRLLLIEDDALLAQATQELLTVAGYEVCWAGSREAAYREILSGGFHTIILDLNLGAERGEAVVESLRAHGHHVPPIIVLSAQSQENLRIAAKVVGAAAVLQKPSSWKILSETIEKVIQSRT